MRINKAILFTIRFLTGAVLLCLIICVFIPIWIIAYMLQHENVERIAENTMDIAADISIYLEKKLC